MRTMLLLVAAAFAAAHGGVREAAASEITLRGVVRDAQDRPVVGAGVGTTWRWDHATGEPVLTDGVRTDPHGRFEVLVEGG